MFNLSELVSQKNLNRGKHFKYYEKLYLPLNSFNLSHSEHNMEET